MAEKKKANPFIIVLLLIIIGFAAGFVVSKFAMGTNEYVEALTDGYAFAGAGLGLLIGIYVAYTSNKKSKKSPLKPGTNTTGTTAAGAEIDLAYDARFLSESELENMPALMFTTWRNLPNVKNTGIIIRNSLIDGKYKINMKDEVHCLVIGTSGSGKTTLSLIPTIRIYGHSGEKPCLVISDPKGELYEQTARIMEDEGYRVLVYNLRDPFSSTRWNPLEHPYKVYQHAHNLTKEVKKFTSGSPKTAGYKTIPGETYGNIWFGFEGVAYPNEQQLTTTLNSKKQILIDQAQNEIKEICNTVAPKSKTANDPTWEEGAQDFLYGCALAMLEDSLIPELGMTADKFNFFNLYKIAMFRDPDADAPFDTIRSYLLEGRNEATSNVPQMTSAVINNAPGTTKSYLGVLNGKVSFMQDIGLCYLTSGSDIDFDDFTAKPTVLYIVVPDDREERHSLAVLCISQLYKRLVDKANSYKGLKLPKHVYFILEEFGNLPEIPKFDSMITVSRGRNILFEMAIQSYTQLESKYGKEKAETIKGNCNAQIFIGTDDQPTKEQFSKLCGEVNLIHEETTRTTNNKDMDSNGANINIQRTKRALIEPYELGQLAKGEVVIKIFKFHPIRVMFTPNYQTPFFYRKDVEKTVGIMKSLDTKAVYYDIKIRNKKILKQSSGTGFSDSDFGF